jgi:hypothetical protein
VIGALLDGGATAVKDESSGIAHGAVRWRELVARAQKAEPLERCTALHRAFVRRPIGSRDLLYSCGMHLLGEPDVELSPCGDVDRDLLWMDTLALYLLAEKPARGVKDGEGFRLEEKGERRVLHAVECDRYESDDFFFNPYGYWRLLHHDDPAAHE